MLYRKEDKVERRGVLYKMRPIEIRDDIAPVILRRAAKEERDGVVCRRLLGIAHLLEGGSRSEAQKIACLTVNTFRIWIQRFNVQGIEGLRSKKSSGRPRKLTSEVELTLKEQVLKGPSSEDGIVRFRLVDLQSCLQKEHGVSIRLSGIWRQLQRLGFTWKTGRQRHPKSDEQVQEAFKKTLKTS